MQCTKLKTYMETGRVVFLPPSRITPNPAQPRKFFSEESLRELAESIRIHGILQPLSVRRVDAHYELIAGERRYRAAQIAGLREIPCIVMRMDDQESGLTALLENLQRQDLNFIEEARALSQLMTRFSLSQTQVAEAVGKSQSAVANKLRLLRHSEPVLTKLLEGDLTERHARALLKLDDECKKLSAISHITRSHLSVAQTEAYIDSLTPQSLPLEGRYPAGRSGSKPPSDEGGGTALAVTEGEKTILSLPQSFASQNPAPSSEGALAPNIQKLLRRFHRTAETLQASGIPITLTRTESPTHITLTLTLPK